MNKVEVDVKEYQELKKYKTFLREILETFFKNPDKVIEDVCVYNNSFDIKDEILFHLKCLNWDEKLYTDFHTSMNEYIRKLKHDIDLMEDISKEVRRKKIGVFNVQGEG